MFALTRRIQHGIVGVLERLLGRPLARLKRQRAGYWALAVALIVVGYVTDSYWVEQSPFWIHLRYATYQWALGFHSRPALVTSTAVVLIGDREYWQEGLAGRKPLRRDYLAKLVWQLDSANVAVIGLDVDLRAPIPGRPTAGRAPYATEEAELFDALASTSRQRGVVVPTTLWRSPRGPYFHDPDITDSLIAQDSLLHTGFIALPPDVRRLPVDVRLRDGSYVESFPVAVARCFRPEIVEQVVGRRHSVYPFCEFLPPQRFTTVTAQAVLDSLPAVRERLKTKIVLVGGSWSELASGRGRQVDTHFTPVGNMPGVYLMANYVEAVLDARCRAPFSGLWINAISLLLTLFCAALLTLAERATAPKRMLWAILGAVGLLACDMGLLMWTGIYADCIVPILLVLGAVLLDIIAEEKRSRAMPPE